MEFNCNDDLRRFAKLLAAKLESIGKASIAHDLNEWNETAFLPSELLGELRIILSRVESLNDISPELKQQVSDCISAINKAFGQ